MEPRARQNVIFELGFFISRLGRSRVCPLVRSPVTVPSDYAVAYVELDPYGAWKLELAREIKSAGIEVDLNKSVGS